MSSQKPKQGYKLVTSDFRQELEIPSVWKISKLSDLTKKTKAGGTPKSTESSFYGGKIPFVSIRDISKSKKYLEFTEKTLTEKGLKNSAGWKIPSNSILYSMYATIGKPIINKIEVCTHQGILGIIVDTEKIDNEFLYYGLLNIKGKLVRYFLTGTQSNLNLDLCKKLQIIHPNNINEQKKIASILSTIDSLISTYDEILSQTKRQKQSLVQQLLTKGIGHTKFKDSKFGKIPASWNIEKISNFCKIIDTPHYTSPIVNQGIPVITTANCNMDGRINYTNVKFTTFDEYQERRKSINPDVGDVLFTREAPSGIAVYVDKKEIAVGQRIILLKFDKTRIDGKYIVYFLNSYLGKLQSNSFSIKTTVERINISDIRRFMMPLPSIQEQNSILLSLSNITSKILKSKSKKIILKNIKKGLMQELLTGQIRVKV